MHRHLLPFVPAVLVGSLVLASGCAPEVTLALAVDDARGAVLGEDGPRGVLLQERTMRVRGDEPLRVTVAVPTLDGETAAPGPPALVVQGGLADADRYRWLAIHLASRGLVVGLPDHALDLAFFSTGDALEVLDAMRRDSREPGDLLEGAVQSTSALIAGHSLGGVVASSLWLQEPALFSHLLLLASIPNPDDDVGAVASGRVLSLAGGADGKISADEVVAGAAAFRAPTTVARVEGMTHYQWTNDASADDIAADAEPTLDDAVVRRTALFLVDALVADLRGERAGVASAAQLLDTPALWPAGLTSLADQADGVTP